MRNKKELLLYLGLSLGAVSYTNTGDIEVTHISQACQALTMEEHKFVRGGLTLPLSIDGKTSIVFYNDKGVLPHEYVHAQQICEQGAAGFLIGYLRNPDFYEQDADTRSGRKIHGD